MAVYRASGRGLDASIDCLLAAQAATQECTACIRTRSEGFGPKPKMAYVLTVLEDLARRAADEAASDEPILAASPQEARPAVAVAVRAADRSVYCQWMGDARSLCDYC